MGCRPIIAAALLAAAVACSETPGGTGRFTPGACRYVLSSIHQQAMSVECGVLSAPELHGEQDGPRIELPVATFALSAEVRAQLFGTSPPAPMILLTGGPGQPAQSVALEVDPDLLTALGRDLIVYEQRGIGLSMPALECREDEALGACRDRHQASGVRLEAYNTEQNARDVCALIEAMGLPAASLRGGSYGALLAQRVITLCPERIHSAWLDAVLPPDRPWTQDLGTKFTRSLERVFGACAADPACNGKYPALQQRFERLLVELPPVFTPTGAMSRGELLGNLFGGLYDPEFIRILPGYLDAVREQRLVAYEAAARAGRPGTQFRDRLSLGMYFAVTCNDDLQYYDLSQAEISSEGLHPVVRAHFLRQQEQLLLECATWPKRAPESVPLEPSTVPVLITAGGFDPITPPDGGRRVADALGRAQFVQLSALSHGALGNPCALELWRAFVRAPDLTVDARCARDARIEFYLEP